MADKREFESYSKGTNCRAWLLRILRNKWINFLRHKEHVEKAVVIEDDLADTPESIGETTWSDCIDLVDGQRSLRVAGHVNAFVRRLVWPTAAAAVGLVVMIGIHTLQPSAAEAARAELVNIHAKNVAGNHEFYAESDPAKLAEYFKDKLDFVPSLPEPGKGMALRGCCMRQFKDQVVGSYVVDTPKGMMSIIVVEETPEEMGMAADHRHKGYMLWLGDFARSNMVAVRLGEYSYCAVGVISHQYLIDLLTRLLPDSYGMM